MGLMPRSQTSTLSTSTPFARSLAQAAPHAAVCQGRSPKPGHHAAIKVTYPPGCGLDQVHYPKSTTYQDASCQYNTLSLSHLMSSSEGEKGRQANVVKASKRPRACDVCRRKRARCDGQYKPDMQCSGCTSQGLDCSYTEQTGRTVPSKKYIANLEHRVEELDKMLRRLCPDEKMYDAWINSLSDEPFESTPPTPPIMQFPPLSIFRPGPIESITHTIRQSHTYEFRAPLEEDDDMEHTFPTTIDTNRFYGKSSGEGLVRKALSMRNDCIGSKGPILSKRREEFWTIRPWERAPEVRDARPSYVFPEPDLAGDLIELYFEHVNLYQPLLHRPTFERLVRNGLHYGNEGFADVYLLVCAIGARFSSDARVLSDDASLQRSAGWKWFHQVETGKTSLLTVPSLYDIQAYCLTISFIQASSIPQSIWMLIGIAIRMVQEVGVHRRKATLPTVEDELWKRAFWVLIYMDRVVCLGFGRPITIQEEDFDQDLPIDCDDEYWEHPDQEQRFKQPPNKPSLISGFIHQLKMIKILAICSKVLYPLNKVVKHLGLVGHQWKLKIVAELDSSLNRWLESMPEHLLWDPGNSNDKFFQQSASLYAICYFTQIFIHRPFIPLPGKSPPLGFPSLAICTTAARACIRVAEVLFQRGVVISPLVQFTAFTSAIMLLFGVWDGKSTPRARSAALEQSPDMENVRKTLQILKAAEEQWPHAGKLVDILASLSSVEHRPGGKVEQGAFYSLISCGSEGTAASTSHSIGVGREPPVDLVPPINDTAMWFDEDPSVALAQSLLSGPSASDENFWADWSVDDLVDERRPSVPDLFSFGTPAPSTSPSAPPSVDPATMQGLSTWPSEVHLTDNPAVMLMMGTGQGDQPNAEAHGGLSGADTPEHYLTGSNDSALNGDDIMNMWLHAPIGTELDDWQTYLTSFQKGE
ncbi:unnamed protein product [Cyclocybe aegerita]|uniref:Zn(2)-C6 fungal-type domain-containing protein n=1 Tax=Cyclocybe aegerita TaxID=1973307 RepID=A0A8S0WPL0_CYCAE|nr:unnamed protein product [Cyclocybe aegerita]